MKKDIFNAAVALMDDEIREAVAADLAPCSEREFLAEYCRRHAERFGEVFMTPDNRPALESYDDAPDARYSLIWIGEDALNTFRDGETIAAYDDEREAVKAADELTAKYADRFNPAWGGISVLDNATEEFL